MKQAGKARRARRMRVDLVHRSVWSVWINQINETNQTNQSNQSGLALHVPRTAALADFFNILLEEFRFDQVADLTGRVA